MMIKKAGIVMIKKQSKIKNLLIDGILFVVASLLIGISTACFAAPNKLAPGGVTGLSTILNYLFGWSIGSLNLLFNIPLFIWAIIEFWGRWRKFVSFISKTFVATVLTSMGIKFMEDVVDSCHNNGINLVYSGDIMVATVISGVLTGVGLALVFMRGGTTGGTDLVAKLAGMHLKHVPLGQILLLVDLFVVAASAVVYREITSPVYSGIVIFVLTKIIDVMLYGASSATGKVMFIVSPESKKISQKIMKDLSRGVTFLKSCGGYSGKEGEIILCAVRRNEVHRIYEIIHEFDESAFVIVGDAGEITGKGFGTRL